jgi:hypothetical protein
MKLLFFPAYLWDLEAPTLLPVQRISLDGYIERFRVWCPHCRDWHYHGPRDGHREMLPILGRNPLQHN